MLANTRLKIAHKAFLSITNTNIIIMFDTNTIQKFRLKLFIKLLTIFPKSSEIILHRFGISLTSDVSALYMFEKNIEVTTP